jgi:hypothetical protein
MVNKNHNYMPIILNTIFNLITLAIAYLVIHFMNDLSQHPQCKMIDPDTRNGLTVYTWIVVCMTSLSILINLYVLCFL